MREMNSDMENNSIETERQDCLGKSHFLVNGNKLAATSNREKEMLRIVSEERSNNLVNEMKNLLEDLYAFTLTTTDLQECTYKSAFTKNCHNRISIEAHIENQQISYILTNFNGTTYFIDEKNALFSYNSISGYKNSFGSILGQNAFFIDDQTLMTYDNNSAYIYDVSVKGKKTEAKLQNAGFVCCDATNRKIYYNDCAANKVCTVDLKTMEASAFKPHISFKIDFMLLTHGGATLHLFSQTGAGAIYDIPKNSVTAEHLLDLPLTKDTLVISGDQEFYIYSSHKDLIFYNIRKAIICTTLHFENPIYNIQLLDEENLLLVITHELERSSKIFFIDSVQAKIFGELTILDPQHLKIHLSVDCSKLLIYKPFHKEIMNIELGFPRQKIVEKGNNDPIVWMNEDLGYVYRITDGHLAKWNLKLNEFVSLFPVEKNFTNFQMAVIDGNIYYLKEGCLHVIDGQAQEAFKDEYSDTNTHCSFNLLLRATGNAGSVYLYNKDQHFRYFNTKIRGFETLCKTKIPHVVDFAVTSDHKYLYYATLNYDISLFDIENEMAVHKINTKKLCKQLELAQNDKLLITATDEKLYIFELPSFTVRKKINIPTLINSSMFISKDNKQIYLNTAGELRTYPIQYNLNIIEKAFVLSLFPAENFVNQNFPDEDDFIEIFESFKLYYKRSFLLRNYFNPWFIAAFYKYSQNFIAYLNNHSFEYPQNNLHQYSPLLLSYKTNNDRLTQSICKCVCSASTPIYFNYEEMKFLISSDTEYLRKVLIKVMFEMKTNENSSTMLPLSTYTNILKNIIHQEDKYFHDLTLRHLFEERPEGNHNDSILKTAKAQKFDLIKGHTTDNLASSEKSGVKKGRGWSLWKPRNRACSFYAVTGQYNFLEGSEDSLYFLRKYFSSWNNEFATSQWTLIIDYKWKKMLWWILIKAALNWANLILFTLLLYNDIKAIYIVLLALSGTLFSIQWGSFLIHSKAFLSVKTNIVDLLTLFNIYVIVGLRFSYDVWFLRNYQIFRVYEVLVLCLVYWKGLNELKVIEPLRHVVDIFVKVSINIIDFLFLGGYLVVSAAVIYATTYFTNVTFDAEGKALNDQYKKIYDETGDYYYEADFVPRLKEVFLGLWQPAFSEAGSRPIDHGGVPYDWLSTTVLVLWAIIISLILINFLIAKMNSTYTEMEAQQLATNYREKAKIILNMEILYYFVNRRNPKYKDTHYCFAVDTTSETQTFKFNLEEELELIKKDMNASFKTLEANYAQEINDLKQQIREMKTSHDQGIKEIVATLKKELRSR